MAVEKVLDGAAAMLPSSSPAVSGEEGETEAQLQCAEGWSKRKRSRRHRTALPTEEEHLALSLLMLARGHRDSDEPAPAQEDQHRCSVCGKAFSLGVNI
ncbi:hypothetical protein E2562_020683 [Oryza meyeriana var. granulata]|uniref:C2H2-type domain-containing protein n=1 Tax=Oryza meyeriana var. granulata TaxID=110450 RepID=A0A6G1EC59_9ORYZ|nr:hypothetical protein E2562_020683 [Oryza meyeriana var. granulata]